MFASTLGFGCLGSSFKRCNAPQRARLCLGCISVWTCCCVGPNELCRGEIFLDHPLSERPGHFPQLTCPCAYLQNPPNPGVSRLVDSPSEGKELSPQDTWIERLPLIHMAFYITHGMSQRLFSLSLESKNGREMCYLRKILHICESNETCLGRFWILHYHACNF